MLKEWHRLYLMELIKVFSYTNEDINNGTFKEHEEKMFADGYFNINSKQTGKQLECSYRKIHPDRE